MSENCKCGGNCETTREESYVKSIEKALEGKKNAVMTYRDAMRKLAEIGVKDESVTALAEAKKRAESEVIKLEHALADARLKEARLSAKNKSKVSLEQKRNDAIQKVKDGLFDFLDSCGLIEAGDREKERAALNRSIDAGVKEIISLTAFASDMGFNMDKMMAAATKEKSQAGSRKIEIDNELASLNSLLDELFQ